MESKSLLLPHKWQILGWWLIPATALLLLYGAFGSSAASGGALQIATIALPFVTMFLICMSQEKIEDKFIRQQRTIAVYAVAVLAFIAGLIAGVAENIMIWHARDINALGSLRAWIFPLKNVLCLSIIYIVVFKGLLAYNYLKSRKDE